MERIDSLLHDRTIAEEVTARRLAGILAAARGLAGYRGMAPPRREDPREDLAGWPLLTKQRIRRLGTSAYLTRPPRADDIVSLTSGTTGTPIEIWRPRLTFRELFASSDLARTWFGVSAIPRRASFTGKLVVPLSSERVWRIDLAMQRLILSQYHLAPARIGRYARVLTRWHPEVLDGYTSNLVELARLLGQESTRVAVPHVVTTCEQLTPQGRALIERVLDARVSDKYGTSENVALAVECPEGRRHVFENLGLIEAVDDDGRPMPDGEVGRLALTTLTNDLMPLVRYEVGDLGAIVSDFSCACGRRGTILSELAGREDDVVVGPDGRRIGILAFNLLRGLRDVTAMQLVQRGLREFEVRAILPVGRLSFEARITSAFDELLGPDPQRTVEFVYPDRLERSPGGKIRNVIRDSRVITDA